MKSKKTHRVSSLFHYKHVALLAIALCLLVVLQILDMKEHFSEEQSDKFVQVQTEKGEKLKPKDKPVQVNTENKDQKENKQDPLSKADKSEDQMPKAANTPENLFFDLHDITDAELDILEDLIGKRNKLNEKSDIIEKREQELKVVESRIDDKITELKRLEDVIQKLTIQKEANENGSITRLVKIYEKMKPQTAASIMEELENEILLSVVKNMSDKKLAAIFAKMDPLKVRFITEELAQQK